MIPADLRPVLDLLRAGRPAEARASLSGMVASGADSAPVHALLARACLLLDDLPAAAAAIDAALSRDAAFVPAWLERAALARRSSRPADAVVALERAAALAPAQPALQVDLAGALAQAGRIADADAALVRCLAAHPGFLPAWLARGRLALDAGQAAAAEAAYAQAQRLAPNDPRALEGLADAAQALERGDAERWARERLVQLEPGSSRRQAEFGDALRRDERTVEASAAFASARTLAPDDLLVRWLAWNTLPVVAESAAQAEDARAGWAAELAAIEALPLERALDAPHALAILSSTTNFYRHYLGEPLRDEQARFGALLRRLAQVAFPAVHEPPPRHGGARRRVAFVSSHFHEHTVLKLFGSWLHAFDRAQVETWAFHLDTREDAWTARVRAGVDCFVGAGARIEDTVAAIRSAAPDLLIHLDVGMHPHSQVLASLRLAPLQAVAWGHPVTTGLDTIDLFLSADAMEPAGGERHYTERLVRLPGPGIVYDAPVAAPSEAFAIALPAGARGYLFCAQSAQKLHPGHDALFARVAAASPDTPIVLVPHHKAHVRDALARRMGRAFRDQGLDPSRHLIVLPGLALRDFLAVARGARVLLDSLDWSGGNTTLETLRYDVPAVTLPGDTLRSRHTAGILDLANWRMGIVRDRDEYVRVATTLATEDDARVDAAAVLAAGKAHACGDDATRSDLAVALATLLDEADTAAKRGSRRAAAEACIGDAVASCQVGDHARARAAFDRALALDPDSLAARWGRFQIPPGPVHADEASADAFAREFRAGLAAFEALDLAAATPRELTSALTLATPFHLHYVVEMPLEEQRRHAIQVERMLAPLVATGMPSTGRTDRGRRRIGFCSSCVRGHAVMKLFERLVTGLDRTRFEVSVFYPSDLIDATTERVRAAVDHLAAGSRTLSAWIWEIASRDLDALVFLDVGMHTVVQALAATRFAPVQAALWGHPVTTGSRAIDWFLSSDAMEPGDGAAHYSERLLRLPDLGACPAPPTTAPAAVPELAGAGSDGRVHALLAQNGAKLQPAHDAVYARVAAAVPALTLHLTPDPRPAIQAALRARLHRAFHAQGLDFDARVGLFGYLDEAGFLGAAARADLNLDAIGWSGGVTSLEILWFDVPTVTLPGRTMRSRHTAAMLHLLGLESLVARDVDDYVRIAVELARDPARRAEVRATIRARKNVLYNSAAVVSAFAAFLDEATRGTPGT